MHFLNIANRAEVDLSSSQYAQKCYFPKSLLFLPEKSVFSAMMRLASLLIYFSLKFFSPGLITKIACSKTSLPVFFMMIIFFILPFIMVGILSEKLFEDIISTRKERYTVWGSEKSETLKNVPLALLIFTWFYGQIIWITLIVE